MRKFLNVYDINLKKIAILENASEIVETKKINSLYFLSFVLPIDDLKIIHCEEFNFVRYGDDGDFYRIISKTFEHSDTGTVSIECEHAIGTLMDEFVFGVSEYNNLEISTIITNLLNKQLKKRWKVGTIFLKGKYSFLWENENLLNSLYSTAKVSEEPYIWKFNFKTNPWTVYLEKIDTKKTPDFYIRATKNILGINETITNTDICTRLYPLGKGEGVNQLTITKIGSKVPYIQSPKEYTDKYGIISRPYIDRSVEDGNTLLALAKAALAIMQVPNYERTFDIIDLYPLSNDDLDKAEVGKITNLTLDNTRVYITETKQNYDVAGDMSITLSTRSNKLDTIIANIAERNRIETTYSQGATQIYAQSISENATKDKGATLSFYIPREMIYINSVNVKIELRSFRTFSEATESGGSTTQTSGNSSVDEVTSRTTEKSLITSKPDKLKTASFTVYDSYSGSTQTQPSGGFSEEVEQNNSTGETSRATTYPGTSHGHTVYHNHRHRFSVKDHNHIITSIPNHYHWMDHSHTYEVPGHDHKVPIGDHQHNVTFPAHTHQLKYGIFEKGGGSSATILLNNKAVLTMGKSGEFNITDKLLGTDGKVPRGSWIKLEVRPNDNSYVHINLFVQGFIQSRGLGTY